MTNYRDLLEKAKQQTKRQKDGEFCEEDLIANLAELIIIDPAAEKLRRAKAIIDSETKPGSTEPSGQLNLPGFDPYDYEPQRLIRDDDGNVIEQDKAPYKFKTSEAKRARKHANEATEWANRKTEESETFTTWVIEQQRKGRTKKLRFGDFVREEELFQPFEESGAA